MSSGEDERENEHGRVSGTPSPMSFSGADSAGVSMDQARDEEDDTLFANSPVFSNPGPCIYRSPEISTPLCECGGIEPHHHQATMNGAGGGETTATSTATATATATGPTSRNARLTNYVQVAKSYVFEQEIQKCLRDTGVSPAREDSIRLAGVQWIDNVRKALKL